MRNPVSYSKELRAAAQETGQQLATLQASGVTLQFAATTEEAKEITSLIRRLIKPRHSKGE